MTGPSHAQHRLGLALVASAALAWSSAGLFARLISADLMTMLFWRGLFSGSFVMLAYCMIERGKAAVLLKNLGWPALAVALLTATAMITGIGSIRFANVADAMIIYATAPFVTAGVAYLFIGERPSFSTVIASVAALFGVAVMLSGSEWGGGLFGKLLAAVMTLATAGYTVIMRRNRGVAMMPAMGAAAFLCSGVCWFFAQPLSVSSRDFGLIGLFGVFQNGAGLTLFSLGSRRVPAAVASRIASLEVPLSPFWVWLILGEAPPVQSLAGGAIVMAALFGHILREFRAAPAEIVQPFQAGP